MFWWSYVCWSTVLYCTATEWSSNTGKYEHHVSFGYLCKSIFWFNQICVAGSDMSTQLSAHDFFHRPTAPLPVERYSGCFIRRCWSYPNKLFGELQLNVNCAREAVYDQCSSWLGSYTSQRSDECIAWCAKHLLLKMQRWFISISSQAFVPSSSVTFDCQINLIKRVHTWSRVYVINWLNLHLCYDTVN